MIAAAGCSTASGDDRKVIDVSREGSLKIINHLESMNTAHGSALQYHLTSVQELAIEYNAKLAPLKPDTGSAISLKAIEVRFFTNANLWAKYYQDYLSSGSSSDLDKANLYKAKMMTAIDDFNDLQI
jgi:hypothetical protein